MSRPLPLALAQVPPLAADDAPLDHFARDVQELLGRFPHTRLVVYPELHLCGVSGAGEAAEAALRDCAEPLDGPRVRVLAQLAGDLGVWLVPGSVCERGPDGELFNTALAFSPEGRLAASYRKLFPWRPHEPYIPGDRFVVMDLPEAGRIGFAICYDAWFPEVARHLAWMGAEAIVSPTLTTTADREQELVLARAAAIANQVFVVNLNAASPSGTGASLIADPEGHVLMQAGEGPVPLTQVLDLGAVARVRRHGSSGLNRLWSQMRVGDPVLPLPLYDGALDPRRLIEGGWARRAEGSVPD